MPRTPKAKLALIAAAVTAGLAYTGYRWAISNIDQNRLKIIRNVFTDRPIIANARIHGTVDLSHSDKALLYNCDLIGTPHESGAAVFMAHAKNATITQCRASKFGKFVQAETASDTSATGS